MDSLMIDLIPILSDNYAALVHDPATGATAVVDPGEAEPVLAALAARGWRLTHVLATHHHHDHVDGIAELKRSTGCAVIGARHDRDRIPGLTVAVGDGDTVALGRYTARVMEIPGHTLGHLAYWFGGAEAVFCGDTLFSLGCGRLFEGTPAQMWASLCRLRALPPGTRVYCGHEYTAANGRFARVIDPGNPLLAERVTEVGRLRSQGLPTIPSTVAGERATNPFLRADTPGLAGALGMAEGADAELVFAELRRRKDVF